MSIAPGGQPSLRVYYNINYLEVAIVGQYGVIKNILRWVMDKVVITTLSIHSEGYKIDWSANCTVLYGHTSRSFLLKRVRVDANRLVFACAFYYVLFLATGQNLRFGFTLDRNFFHFLNPRRH